MGVVRIEVEVQVGPSLDAHVDQRREFAPRQLARGLELATALTVPGERAGAERRYEGQAVEVEVRAGIIERAASRRCVVVREPRATRPVRVAIGVAVEVRGSGGQLQFVIGQLL